MSLDSLENKAISIRGKEYVLVKDRVLAFNEAYPNGSIFTELVENGDRVTIKATVTPDVDKPARVFTGYSQAVWGQGNINTTAATENCETSAVGRALAMMGIGVIESLASADEVHKASNDPRASTKPVAKPPVASQKPQVSNLSDSDDPFDGFVDDFGGREVPTDNTQSNGQKKCEDCFKYYTPKPGTEKFSTKCVSCFIKSRK
jgi:hypothetical protein